MCKLGSCAGACAGAGAGASAGRHWRHCTYGIDPIRNYQGYTYRVPYLTEAKIYLEGQILNKLNS